MIIFIMALLFIAGLWVYFYVALCDSSIPLIKVSPPKRIMAIFPHPDDESLSCAGTLHLFKQLGSSITLVILTKGERGVEGAFLTPRLKPIRTKELARSASYIGVDHLLTEDFGDGTLIEKQDQIEEYLSKVIDKIKPDLLITYDSSGLYGHPDHMIVSEITTRLAATLLPNYALWYISRPQKYYEQFKLPTHMATDQGFINKRLLPTMRIRVRCTGIFAKIMSLMSHKSQKFAFTKNLPPMIPLWFMVSSQIDEYFHIVKVASKK